MVFVLKHFLSFLEKNSVGATIIATILSEHILRITEAFTEYILMPILNKDSDKDGKRDINNITRLKTNVNGVEFKTGLFMFALLKFFLILTTIYLFNILLDLLNFK